MKLTDDLQITKPITYVCLQCPLLMTTIDLEGVGEHDSIKRILTKEMPVKCIQWWTGTRTGSTEDWGLGSTITYIANTFGQTLGK